jgi:hypothetical protein
VGNTVSESLIAIAGAADAVDHKKRIVQSARVHRPAFQHLGSESKLLAAQMAFGGTE